MLDGWRLPFHFYHCSEECRLATERRENESLAFQGMHKTHSYPFT